MRFKFLKKFDLLKIFLFLVLTNFIAPLVFATPAIKLHQVSPSSILVNTPTTVNISARITDSSLIPSSVNLQRLDVNNKVVAILGILRDDGLNGDAIAGDKIFTIQISFNEEIGLIRLRISAAFRGILKRIFSDLIYIKVGAYVGTQGGTLNAPDGASVTFLQEALSEQSFITVYSLPIAESPKPPPPSTVSLGGIVLESSSPNLNLPALITIPLINISLPPGTPLPLFVFDSEKNEYMFDTEALVDSGGITASAQINHFSVWQIFQRLFDSDEQKRRKDDLVVQIQKFLNKYQGQCFYEKGFLSLGDINAVIGRIYDSDIEIYIDPEFLDTMGVPSVAAYVDWDASHFYFNDLVLSREPLELDPNDSTLFHEIMHAIFDKHDRELRNMGVPDDEAITFYLDNVDGQINILLKGVERAIQENRCDLARKYLDMFVSNVLDLLSNPKDSEGKSLPPLTNNVLDFVKNITGFDVDPFKIKQRYEVGECGCLYTLPTPNVGCFSSHFSSGYYVQLYVLDSNKAADSITVKGPGLVTPLSLTFGAYRPGEWWSVPNVFLGAIPAYSPPLTYTFHIEYDGQVYTVDKIVNSLVEQFATNLSPSGGEIVSGDFTFTWTGISLPGIKYQVQLDDNNYNRIWNSEITTGNSIPYTGPALLPGATYRYYVAAMDSYGNQSLAQESFIYGPWLSFLEGNPGIPGDEVFISSTNTGIYDPIFELATPIPLSDFADGFTYTVFLPIGSPPLRFIQLGISNLQSSGPCQVWYSERPFPSGSVVFNGGPGVFTNVSLSFLDSIVSKLNLERPGCGFTLDELYFHHILLEIADPPSFLTTLDAAAVLPGQNAVPPGSITQNQSPVAKITMTAQGKTAYENQTLNLMLSQGQTVNVSFSASRSSDPDGSITSYKWYINGTPVSTARDFSFSLGAGTHQIYLEVWDNLGAQGAVGATIVIIKSPTWSEI